MLKLNLRAWLKWLTPHGLVRLYQSRCENGYRASRLLIPPQELEKTALSHADMISFLTLRGLCKDQIMEGSIPEASLRFLASILSERCDGGTRLRGLHIGNFVGVSLAALTTTMISINSESVMVAIDPDLAHRGISHPQEHVCALLEHCRLSPNVILICGFSGGKNIGDDGRNYLEDYRLQSDEEMQKRLAFEHAPVSVLANLCILGAEGFDFVLVDGNHESLYVEAELNRLHPLMKPGGLIFMDDVSEGWAMLRQVFERSLGNRFKSVAMDGRVGVIEVLK